MDNDNNFLLKIDFPDFEKDLSDPIGRIRNCVEASFAQEMAELKQELLRQRNALQAELPAQPNEPIIQYWDRLAAEVVKKNPYLDAKYGPRVRLMAILFARPSAKIVKEDILSNYDYLDIRSARHIEIVCAGYDSSMKFNENVFVKIIEGIERDTSWKYSGETDMILLNTRYDHKTGAVDLDFREVVSFSIEAALRVKAIESVPAFFESLIRFAAAHTGLDPTWGFSDSRGLEVAGSALSKAIFSLLPKGMEDEFDKAKLFVVKDVARQSR